MKTDEKHEIVGRLQRDFLIDQGLQPHHRLLDIGCGWLRGGRYLIPYLGAGNYVGIEKDRDMIERARRDVLSQPDILAKRPHVVHGMPKPDLMADIGPFDYALALSVFTHLTPDQIEEMLAAVMPHVDVLYASFNRGDEQKIGKTHKHRDDEKTICRYPFETLADLAENCGCEAADLGEFGHPAGQEMAMFWRSA